MALPLLVIKKKHVDLLLIGEGDKKQKGDRKRKTCNKCLPSGVYTHFKSSLPSTNTFSMFYTLVYRCGQNFIGSL